MGELDLKDYIDTLLAREREMRNLQFTAAQLAIDKAEDSMGIRLEGMNEFRKQLERQEASFVTADTLEGIEKRLATLEHSEGIMTGKTAMLWLIIVIGLGLLGIAVQWF